MSFAPLTESRISDSVSICPCGFTLWIDCGPFGHQVLNVSHFKYFKSYISIDRTHKLTQIVSFFSGFKQYLFFISNRKNELVFLSKQLYMRFIQQIQHNQVFVVSAPTFGLGAQCLPLAFGLRQILSLSAKHQGIYCKHQVILSIYGAGGYDPWPGGR